MLNNSTIKIPFTTSSVSNQTHHFIQLDFSPSVRLTRHLIHVIILILFISILAFIGHKRNYPRTSIRPFSHLSGFIVSIGTIGLVLDDLLVINGVTSQTPCSIHQVFLHFLLMIIVAGRLLPDFYEYTNQRDSVGITISFIILLLIQLFISIKWLWTNNNPSHGEWNPPVLCSGSIRPQLFILILHLLDFMFTIQSLHTSMILEENNPILFCQLNSILLRLFYFTGTSILQTFFFPGQFSATFYSGILVIEFVVKYLIVIYQSNVRNIDNTAYLRLKSDDDTRLLNDID